MSNKQILGLLAGIIAGTAAKNVMNSSSSGSAAKLRFNRLKKTIGSFDFPKDHSDVWENGFQEVFSNLEYKKMTKTYFSDFLFNYAFTAKMVCGFNKDITISAFTNQSRDGFIGLYNDHDALYETGIDKVFASYLIMSTYLLWLKEYSEELFATDTLKELETTFIENKDQFYSAFRDPGSINNIKNADLSAVFTVVNKLRHTFRQAAGKAIVSSVEEDGIEGGLGGVFMDFLTLTSKSYLLGMYEAYDNLSDYYSKCLFGSDMSEKDKELLEKVCSSIISSTPNIEKDFVLENISFEVMDRFPLIRDSLKRVFPGQYDEQINLMSRYDMGITHSMKSMFKSISDDALTYHANVSRKTPIIYHGNGMRIKRQWDPFAYSLEYAEMIHFYYLVYMYKYDYHSDSKDVLQSVANLFLNKVTPSSYIQDKQDLFSQIVLDDKHSRYLRISIVPSFGFELNNPGSRMHNYALAMEGYQLTTNSTPAERQAVLEQRETLNPVLKNRKRKFDTVDDHKLQRQKLTKQYDAREELRLTPENIIRKSDTVDQTEIYESGYKVKDDLNRIINEYDVRDPIVKSITDVGPAIVEDLSIIGKEYNPVETTIYNIHSEQCTIENVKKSPDMYNFIFKSSYHKAVLEPKKVFIFKDPIVFERTETKEIVKSMVKQSFPYETESFYDSIALYDRIFPDIYGVKMHSILGFTMSKEITTPTNMVQGHIMKASGGANIFHGRNVISETINVFMKGTNNKTYIYPMTFSAVDTELAYSESGHAEYVSPEITLPGYLGKFFNEKESFGEIINSAGEKHQLFSVVNMTSSLISYTKPIKMEYSFNAALRMFLTHKIKVLDVILGRVCFSKDYDENEWTKKNSYLKKMKLKALQQEERKVQAEKRRIAEQQRRKVEAQKRRIAEQQRKAEEQRQRVAEAARLKAQQQAALQAAKEAQRLAEEQARLQQIARQQEAELQRMIAQQQRQAALQQQADLQRIQRQIEILEQQERVQRQKAKAAEQAARAQRQRMLQQEYVQDVIEARTPVENPDFSFPQGVRIPSQYTVFSDCLLSTINNIQDFLNPNIPWQWAILCSMKELVVNLRMQSMPDGDRFDPNRVIRPWTFYQRIFSFESFIGDVLSLATQHMNTVESFNCYWAELPNSCISLGIPLEYNSEIIAWFAVKRGDKDFRPQVYQNSKPILKCIFVGVVGETQYTDFVIEIPHISINTSTGQRTFKRSCISYRLIVSGKNGYGEWELDRFGLNHVDDVLRMELGAIWISLASIMRNRYLQRNIIIRPRVRNGNVEPENPGPTEPVNPNNPNFVIRTKEIELARDASGAPLGRLEVRNVYVPANAVADSEGKQIGPNWVPPEFKATTVAQDKLEDRLNVRELAVFQDSNLRDNPYVLQWQAFRDDDGNVVRRPSDNQLVRMGGRGVKIYEPLSDYHPDELVEQQFYWNREEDRPKYYYKAWKEVKGWARDEHGNINPFTFPYLSIIDVY